MTRAQKEANHKKPEHPPVDRIISHEICSQTLVIRNTGDGRRWHNASDSVLHWDRGVEINALIQLNRRSAHSVELLIVCQLHSVTLVPRRCPLRPLPGDPREYHDAHSHHHHGADCETNSNAHPKVVRRGTLVFGESTR